MSLLWKHLYWSSSTSCWTVLEKRVVIYVTQIRDQDYSPRKEESPNVLQRTLRIVIPIVQKKQKRKESISEFLSQWSMTLDRLIMARITLHFMLSPLFLQLFLFVILLQVSLCNERPKMSLKDASPATTARTGPESRLPDILIRLPRSVAEKRVLSMTASQMSSQVNMNLSFKMQSAFQRRRVSTIGQDMGMTTPLKATNEGTAPPAIDGQTLPCPESYQRFYCLNQGKCFLINTGISLEYNCEWVLLVVQDSWTQYHDYSLYTGVWMEIWVIDANSRYEMQVLLTLDVTKEWLWSLSVWVLCLCRNMTFVAKLKVTK